MEQGNLQDIEQAMKVIEESGFTCIVQKQGEDIFHSQHKGVKPLMDYIGEQELLEPIRVLDKIVGKGAMVLAIKAKAYQVITPIISEKALDLAKKHDVAVAYNQVVPYIVNRTGTGPCPIESVVTTIDDIEEGYSAIIKTLQALRKQGE